MENLSRNRIKPRLTAIGGYAELLLEDLEPTNPRRGDVVEIQNAAGRAAALTRQLLAFSRKQFLAPQVLDLNSVVMSIDKLLQRLIGEDVDIVTILEPDLGCAKADPGQIEQVILNLAVNARDAMPQGGKLTIETANADIDECCAHQHFAVPAGSYVVLAVSDTGCGMDEATQSHLFEPFFTTKAVGVLEYTASQGMARRSRSTCRGSRRWSIERRHILLLLARAASQRPSCWWKMNRSCARWPSGWRRYASRYRYSTSRVTPMVRWCGTESWLRM